MAKRSSGGRGKDNIIHVRFGSGGGRIEAGASSSAATAESIEPVSDVFSAKEVAKLLGMTTAKQFPRSAWECILTSQSC